MIDEKIADTHIINKATEKAQLSLKKERNLAKTQKQMERLILNDGLGT